MDESPVDRLKRMSPQARVALKGRFSSLEEAAARPDAELLAIPGFKASSLARLRAWQADPEAPQEAAGRFQPWDREDRVHALYVALRGLWEPPEEARRMALEEVDALQAVLREAR